MSRGRINTNISSDVQKPKSLIARATKIVLWILAGIVGLAILAVVALQFPGVQRYIAQRATLWISEKTHTRIEVGSVNIAFTRSVVLHDIFVESHRRDTLLSIQTLSANVNLLGLFSTKVSLQDVRLDSVTAHITRTLPDSAFNFDFIIDALSSDSNPDPDTSAQTSWNITLGSVGLNGVNASYDDEVSGTSVLLRLGTLEATIDSFDLDKMQFHIDELSIQNATASVIQSKELPPDESTPADFNVGFHEIALESVHFLYRNKVTDESYDVDLGTANLLAKEFDLVSQTVSLEKFQLEDSKIVVALPE